jgi:hypothetical protein
MISPDCQSHPFWRFLQHLHGFLVTLVYQAFIFNLDQHVANAQSAVKCG